MRIDVATLSLSFAIACGAPTPDPPRPPQLFRVEIHGALIGVAKTNGHAWDPGSSDVGLSEKNREIANALADVVGLVGGPKGAALAAAARVGPIFAAAGVDHLAHPDPFGYAEIDLGDGNGFRFHQDLAKNEDTFTPTWTATPVWWSHLFLSDQFLLRVHLDDADLLTADDHIATVQIRASELLDVAGGQILPIRVYEQDSHQLLFVTVAVVPE